MQQDGYPQGDPVLALIKELLPSVVVESDAEPEPGVVGQCYHVRPVNTCLMLAGSAFGGCLPCAG